MKTPLRASLLQGASLQHGAGKYGRIIAICWPLFVVVLSLLLLAGVSSAQGDNNQISNTFVGLVTVAEKVVFTTTGSMTTTRFSHTSTRLPNNKVLIAGGSTDSSAELYDPTAGTFTTTTSMSASRSRHAATRLQNGKVLITGGCCYNATDLSSADVYDPVAESFSATSNMTTRREQHTATLLPTDKVLIVGGTNAGLELTSAELYDLSTGTFTTTGSMQLAHPYHTATFLPNGKVLIVGITYLLNGGAIPPAELYDPSTGTFTITASTATIRYHHTATLLPNGMVLIVGGEDSINLLASAELYDVTNGTFAGTVSLSIARKNHTATLLPDGNVLIAGGLGYSGYLTSTEIYDWFTGKFIPAGNLVIGRYGHTASDLSNDKILIGGGYGGTGGNVLSSAEVGTFIPANTFTASLTLPSGWIITNTGTITFIGGTLAADLNAAALSNDGITWSNWIAITSGQIVIATWNFGGDGANKPVYLRLRDVNNQVAQVVTGTVKIDTTAPTSSMAAIPLNSSGTIPLVWFGYDFTSGVIGYDLQARHEITGIWTSILTGTLSTSTIYTATDGNSYFRVRANDAAGNVEPWPSTYDAFTVVDATPPTGTMTINSGANYAASRSVALDLSASDAGSGVAMMAFSNDGTNFTAFEPYATSKLWTLPSGDGLRTVYVQFRDGVGNISQKISATILLDQTPPTGSISIADVFSSSVTLNLSAIDNGSGVNEMMLSNQPNFAGATWEPYLTVRAWTLDSNNTVYIKYRDNAGNISPIYSASRWLSFLPVVVK